MINIDVRDAIRELRKGTEHLNQSRTNLAIARAINDAIVTGRKEAQQAARETYNVKASDLKKDIQLKKSDRLTLTGRIMAKTMGMAASRFGARQRKDGVSIEVKKGNREVVKSAFIRNTGNGFRGVFARGRYQGPSFQFRKERINKTGPDLPIGSIRTISAYNAITNRNVMNRVMPKVSDQFAKRLVHHLNRATGGSPNTGD